MFENSKKTNKILKTFMNDNSLFFDRNNRKEKISKIITNSELELEKVETLIDTLVKGLKEIYLSKTNLEIADKIVDLIDFYNKYTKDTEPKIAIEEDVLKSSIEKRLESIYEI